MTPASIESRIRARLPAARFIQEYLPLRLLGWLSKQGAARLRFPADIAHEAVSVEGVPAVWFIPQNSPQDKALLYLHGGGFIFGLSQPHLEMVAYLAQKLGLRTLVVDYCLAPEHPYPAPLDDCVTAYRWLLKQGFSSREIVVAGDSAGGNLTITMLMKLRDCGDPLPAAAACLSPVGDLSKHGSAARIKDPLLPARAVEIYNKSYVADNDPREPLISPVFGRWEGLPPLLVHAGADEILCNDALRIGELAKAAGVDVRLEIYPRMWHVWQLFLSLPQARQSLDDIAGFLGGHVGMGTQAAPPD
jgi:epsilon-lactone hydrolase